MWLVTGLQTAEPAENHTLQALPCHYKDRESSFLKKKREFEILISSREKIMKPRGLKKNGKSLQ